MIHSNEKRFRNRSGISIIEVLTAILVAMIGVFGVMVMIPFAVSQAQHGLDQETATSLALNAVNEFEIRNHVNTNRWAGVDAGGNLISIGNIPVRSYVIDPRGVAARQNAAIPQGSGFFPFVHPDVEAGILASGSYSDPMATYTGLTDQNILMDRVTIANVDVLQGGGFPAGAQGMSRDLANHLFAWSNDLVFNEATENDIVGAPIYPEADLAPPQQVFDVDAAGNAVRRQSIKDMSYIVVATPTDVASSGNYDPAIVADRVTSWRNYFVVYKKRAEPVGGLPIGKDPYDRVFEVLPPVEQVGVAPDPLDPLAQSYRVSVAGGDFQMTEVPPPLPPGVSDYTAARREIRRGDWMMLTNVTFAGGVNRNRFFQQVNFYKIIDAEFDGTQWFVSLQGPDFDFMYPMRDNASTSSQFFPPNVGDAGCTVNFDGSASPAYQIRPSRTYAVHLPDVWTVFERTFR